MEYYATPFGERGRLFFCSILCSRFELIITACLRARACEHGNKGSNNKFKDGAYFVLYCIVFI